MPNLVVNHHCPVSHNEAAVHSNNSNNSRSGVLSVLGIARLETLSATQAVESPCVGLPNADIPNTRLKTNNLKKSCFKVTAWYPNRMRMKCD